MFQNKGYQMPKRPNAVKSANSANLHRETSATFNRASAIYRIGLKCREGVSKLQPKTS